MSRKYLYKNIVIFRNIGGWQADYRSNGKQFAIHRACCRTKAQAYAIAKEDIDYLNNKED